MSQFVDQCRREWRRLGVPGPAAEEMASDLEADLAEAALEGASPEQVLGNGVFDARSFAASWAVARGVARPGARILSGAVRLWGVVAGAAISLFVALVGLAAVGSGHASAFSVAAVRRSAGFAFPGPLGGARHFSIIGPVPGEPLLLAQGPLHAAGFVLVGLGVAGLAASLFLWLRWRPLTAARRRWHQDGEMSLRSYL